MIDQEAAELVRRLLEEALKKHGCEQVKVTLPNGVDALQIEFIMKGELINLYFG